jgi:hypothetical protein
MVGISKTEVGDSLNLLLGALAALGICQPDGTFVTSLADLTDRLVEMAATGEAAVVDGLATRVQRPRSWANQKVLYDAKRHTHTARAWRCPRSTATCCGVTAAGLAAAMSMSCWRCRGSIGCWTPLRLPPWSTAAFGGWPSSLLVRVRDVFRAAAALISLGRWLHRRPAGTGIGSPQAHHRSTINLSCVLVHASFRADANV